MRLSRALVAIAALTALVLIAGVAVRASPASTIPIEV